MFGLKSSLCLALAVVCGPASAALLSVEGEARDAANGRLLYREEHLIQSRGKVPSERVVLYRCPDGTAFARKRVDYSGSQTAPSFSLTDARDGYREGMKRAGGGEQTWSGSKIASIDGDAATLIADAGFDEFLRLRWDTLLAKKSMPIDFVVPSFGKAMAFNVNSLGRKTIDGTAVQSFRLKLDGLLGLVAPTIDVAYNSSDRSLRRFTGVSNIRSDAGKNLKTRIDFPKAATSAPAGQWQAALDAPLTACTLGS